jgi:hypothetical protein
MDGMPIRLGPVGLSPTLTITHFGVDSNVFNETVDPKSDFTMTATPRMQARLRSGRLLLSGALGTGLVYYQRFDDERSIDYSTEGRADVDLGSFRPYAFASRYDTRERLNVELDVRAPRAQTNLAAGGRYQTSPRTGLVFAARRSSVRFDEGALADGIPLSRTLNSDINILEAGAEFQLTPLTTLSVVASRQQDRFTSAPERDADTIKVLPTVRMEAPAIVQGSLSVGFRHFDGLNPALPDFNGLVFQGALGHTFGERTRLDVSLSRDVQYSFEEASPYYLLSTLRVTVVRQIRDEFDVRASAGRDRLDYRTPDDAVSLPDDSRRDRWSVLSGGIGYRYRPNLRVGVDVEYAKRSSARADREFDRTRLLGSLTYGF